MTVQEKLVTERRGIEGVQDHTIDMLDTAIDTGAATNEQLVRQGEQLRGARRNMAEIKENNEVAEEHIENMEMCCCIAIIYSCCCCCCEQPVKAKPRAPGDISETEARRAQTRDERMAATAKSAEIARRRESLDRIKADSKLTDEERHEAAVGKGLDLMSAQLGRVEQIVKAQKTELKDQEHTLDKFGNEVDSEGRRIHALNSRAKRLLNG